MVLISGIAIIVLVVAGVAMLLAVMQENAGIINAGVEIDKHSNERNREDVDMIAGNRTALELHNRGPGIDILEYRVLDDDGTVLRVCAADKKIGTAAKETLDTASFDQCWREFAAP